VQADLRAVSERDRAVEDAAEALGGLDVLVNNAGVVHPRDFLDTDEAVFDLNVKGYLFCAKRAVPFMLEAGGGNIVNVEPNSASFGVPAQKGQVPGELRPCVAHSTTRYASSCGVPQGGTVPISPLFTYVLEGIFSEVGLPLYGVQPNRLRRAPSRIPLPMVKIMGELG
jgi:NAD(P)-dependent dehydrogenase (short-subunit alcohol dehydrogenase family)